MTRTIAATPERATQAPSRVTIERITPCIDCGRFPIKRAEGEKVVVEADVFADGHDLLSAVVRYRPAESGNWRESPMVEIGQDRRRGEFYVDGMGEFEYTVEAWIDKLATWRRDLKKKFDAGQDVSNELLEGAALLRRAADKAHREDADSLRSLSSILANATGDQASRVADALQPDVALLMDRCSLRDNPAVFPEPLKVSVDRPRAVYGAWYEMFPRSCHPEPGRHGTLRDAAARLDYVASMGFDVIYLPPIHPIGYTARKGPNNSLVTREGDPGSPWGIGSAEGGHKAVHPDLGTIDDFDHFVLQAEERGLEVALDIAFQCSPDHPYVREHPEWFQHRPDGTIKYAENPPKKYQDIYPIDFECAQWRELWNELKSVVLFWIDHGVTIFRVDNPHTKSFRFWEWMIAEVKRDYPQAIFLSEAFTRPKVMQHLAKAGFTQSYTYFTWRNSKSELTEYLTELTRTEVSEYLRPNFFVNTPDILHEYLQRGGRAAFQIRLVLAATLAASYGVYGPPFEFCEGRGVPGSEEYHDSEKYQVRHWDLRRTDTLREFLTKINEIRRENPALHSNIHLRFTHSTNDQIIAYLKMTEDRSNVVLVVVNLDPWNTQAGHVQVPYWDLDLPGNESYSAHEVISDARYAWGGEYNYVCLNPYTCPAHIIRLRPTIRTGRDFDSHA